MPRIYVQPSASCIAARLDIRSSCRTAWKSTRWWCRKAGDSGRTMAIYSGRSASPRYYPTVGGVCRPLLGLRHPGWARTRCSRPAPRHTGKRAPPPHAGWSKPAVVQSPEPGSGPRPRRWLEASQQRSTVHLGRGECNDGGSNLPRRGAAGLASLAGKGPDSPALFALPPSTHQQLDQPSGRHRV